MNVHQGRVGHGPRVRGRSRTERSMSYVAEEIASQPGCWRQATALAAGYGSVLPRSGERVAIVGCGTSWFIAQAYASLRETAGQGETDAFAASEMPMGRSYDRVLAVTRSGTTTEVLSLLATLRGKTHTVVITADPRTATSNLSDDSVVLDFADERSVVQTRFATTALALLRAHLGEDLTRAIAEADRAVAQPAWNESPDGSGRTLLHAEQFAFLGSGWTYGLAQEAALKLREAARAWTEAHPAMEYRHGPISVAGPGRVTWVFGDAPNGLANDVRATGATLRVGELEPMAELVRVQRLAVAIAEQRGLDPDNPRHLTRSVVLDDN